MTVHVIAYDTADPGDTSELSARLAAFSPETVRRLSLLVKTEGNSDVNDFSRQYGLLAARNLLVAWGGEAIIARCSFLFSTGCEGAMTPFGYLFLDVEDGAAPVAERALALGVGRSRSLRPEEIGTPAHADLVAATVEAAMADAGVTRDEVALVIVKTPVMSHIPATEAPKTRNKRVTSGYSKAVGALGAGVALGEVDRAAVVQEAFDTDHSLHARRAMVFSGSETDQVEILLLANRPGAPGRLAIGTGHFADMLDIAGIRRVIADAGIGLDAEGNVAEPGRIAAMLVKAGVAPDGMVRGCRTTIKSSHIDMDKHVRATVAGLVASVRGTCRNFVSANTVHQAPAGGGLCACIVEQAG